MQQIDMSGNLPMLRRAGNAKVRYSAAYPTGREFCDEPYHIDRITRGWPSGTVVIKSDTVVL